VEALARQAAKQQHPGIARARQLGQIQDDGPPGPATGLAQDRDGVVMQASDDPDGREIGRLGHDQAESHLARFPFR
jgi:hypothetical protein